MNASDANSPLLWQLAISHYSEKVRWALDHKRVPHRRRSTLPGLHIPVALYLTRGAAITFPVLRLGEEAIADSTAAIAALERGYPERPLYPEGPAERRRALALEEYFDEELGPATRLLAFHELGREPERFGEVAAFAVPPPLSRAKSLLSLYGRFLTRTRYGVAEEAAAGRARGAIVAALKRIEVELATGDGVHLVGESFSVADLTGAALFFPLVMPAGAPLPADLELPRQLELFRSELRDHPGYRWVEEIYRRYRAAPADGPISSPELPISARRPS